MKSAAPIAQQVTNGIAAHTAVPVRVRKHMAAR